MWGNRYVFEETERHFNHHEDYIENDTDSNDDYDVDSEDYNDDDDGSCMVPFTINTFSKWP